MRHVLVTGGAGYLGSVLVPKLLAAGCEVTVFDCLLFGPEPLAPVRDHEHLTVVQGDLRDASAMQELYAGGGFTDVIHLAAISNDPSSDLDPELTRAVNLDGTRRTMELARQHGVSRFLYASSASVYGIQDTPDVTEELPKNPITLYARYKLEGEGVLNELVDDSFVGVSVRAATVCGYSPRLRLDLTVNILTDHAVNLGRIRVFGGSQMRPNIHIEDLTDLYVFLLDAPAEVVSGRAYNVSLENASVRSLAERIQAVIDPELPIETVPADDDRSYHLSARRMHDELGFHPQRTVRQAISELRDAFADGRVPEREHARYRNVVRMREHPEFWRLAGS